MATPNKFNCLSGDIGKGKHNFQSDSLKVALTNTLPVVGNTVLANITQIAAGNGYTAGGQAVSKTIDETAGTFSVLESANTTFTATGGAMATFRYAVLYNDTSATDPLIAWYDYGSAVTLNAGQSLVLSFDLGIILTVQ